MKKSILSIALLLSMLFVLGACFSGYTDSDGGSIGDEGIGNGNTNTGGGDTGDGDNTDPVPPDGGDGKPEDHVIPGATGNPVIDAGIKDALDQLGSVDGMEIWSYTNKAITENYYFLGTEYKFVSIQLNAEKTEIVTKIAKEGTLEDSTAFKLSNSKGKSIKNKKGYTKLFTYTPENSYKKALTDGEWINDEVKTSSYRISKVSENNASTIIVNKKKASVYQINRPYLANTITKDARTYTKKQK